MFNPALQFLTKESSDPLRKSKSLSALCSILVFVKYMSVHITAYRTGNDTEYNIFVYCTFPFLYLMLLFIFNLFALPFPISLYISLFVYLFVIFVFSPVINSYFRSFLFSVFLCFNSILLFLLLLHFFAFSILSCLCTYLQLYFCVI